jgi:hypothetical protein
MKELADVIQALAMLLTAIVAAIAAWEARQANRRAKKIARELDVNPQKSADAVVKALNGTLPPATGSEPDGDPH